MDFKNSKKKVHVKNTEFLHIYLLIKNKLTSATEPRLILFHFLVNMPEILNILFFLTTFIFQEEFFLFPIYKSKF